MTTTTNTGMKRGSEIAKEVRPKPEPSRGDTPISVPQYIGNNENNSSGSENGVVDVPGGNNQSESSSGNNGGKKNKKSSKLDVQSSEQFPSLGGN